MTITTFDKGRWSAAAGVPTFLCPGFLREIVRAARDRTGPFGFMTALNPKSTMACQEPGRRMSIIPRQIFPRELALANPWTASSIHSSCS